MVTDFNSSLSALIGTRVSILPGNGYPEPGQASVLFRFSTGAKLTAAYWRIIEGAKAGISSFDHEQKYGLPAPIDAVAVLRDCLADREVTRASLDHTTGDLLFAFSGEVSVQVFNFTAYEIWDMSFSDGAVEYSNYNK